jgi:polyferredoxin
MIRRCTSSSLRVDPRRRIDTRRAVRNGFFMTADAGAGPLAATAASAWRAVVVFVVLTALLSGVFWALINPTQTVTALYVFALMWMPGVAAVLT